MASRPKPEARNFTVRVSVASATPLKPAPCYYRESGAFAIMFALLLMVIIGFCGIALDIGPLYNRKVDLNKLADAVALAAAKELNGTAAGIAAAKASAKQTAERLTYKNGITFTWDDAALSFSDTPSLSGTWVSASGTVSSPQSLYYAKVETALLDAATGEVNPVFMPMLSSNLASLQLSHTAVAGRTAINVTPIAICAMSPTAAGQRTNTGLTPDELVEYGFRRGVSYDLMQLNPNGVAPARYLVNPVIAPGVNSAVFDTSTIGQFICTGTMWVPRLTGGSMRVSALPASSPLATISQLLNSRFDVYTAGSCSPNGAPPDYNVKEYTYDTDKVVSWMSPTKGLPAAASTTSRGKLETIADLPAPPAGTQQGDYGPLWSYAKAAKYAASEPSGGYASFAAGNWGNLYKSGPTAPSYPTASSTPYLASKGANYAGPAATRGEISTENRRVLNIPLLSCPVASGSNVQATVLGIGRFFMTVKATDDKLIAEFAGMASPTSANPATALTGAVELY